MKSDRRPHLAAVPDHDGDDTWPLIDHANRADLIAGTAVAIVATVGVVGALTLKERCIGLTFACIFGAIGIGAAHQWLEGRR